MFILVCFSCVKKRTSVELVYGYLKVFPNELGSHDSVPLHMISKINQNESYGYNTWRLPTIEELSYLQNEGYLFGKKYMTQENQYGKVLLVTDKDDAATLRAEEEKRIEKEKQEQREKERLAKIEKEKQERKKYNGHKYVDLGLPSGIKWATCNVGADNPKEYGNYYAWGEIETKSIYIDENSTTYGKEFENIKSDSQYDVAKALWGGNWRLPTDDECKELTDMCTWELIDNNDINIYKIIGPNGNYIYLPAGGQCSGMLVVGDGIFGFYWTSRANSIFREEACALQFSGSSYSVRYRITRSLGLSIRPVAE